MVSADAPFQHFHYGSLEDYGNSTANFRAEVGLLTRNVLFSNGNKQNGYHLTFIGQKSKGLRFKISGVEMQGCGVPSLGKSCINVLNAGEMNGSYLRQLSVHDTGSRMITVSSSDYV